VFAKLLRERLGAMVDLSSEQVSELERHFKLLNRWNNVLNLTAIRDLEESVERHYCESLFLGSKLPAGALQVADVGSGAGFPGIPVAVLRPDCSIALIESHQRKCVFLSEASRGINNVRVIPKRAEEVSERFDWLISRAVKSPHIVAANVAILTGDKPPYSECFTWNKIEVPWGRHRFLWIGTFHVKHPC
jgi:16S rRNA (guanine527-N7)-methyltransferase